MIRLLTILLFITSVAQGQFTTAVFTIDGSSVKVGAIVHIPGPGPGKTGTIQSSGNKPSMGIYLAGIDQYYTGSANGGQFDTTGTYGQPGGAKWLVNKSVPLMRYLKPTQCFQIPGTVGPAGQEGFALIAPQCDNGTPEWPQNLLIGCIKYVINTYGSLIDTNRIWVFGYSLGGIGAKHFAANVYLRSKVSYIFLLSSGPTRAYDYAGQAANGPQIDVLWNNLDQLSTATADGVGWVRPFVQNLNANSPVAPVQFWEMTGASTTYYGANFHDTWQLIVYDSLGTFHPTLANGDTWIREPGFPFTRAISFTKDRLHRLAVNPFQMPDLAFDRSLRQSHGNLSDWHIGPNGEMYLPDRKRKRSTV